MRTDLVPDGLWERVVPLPPCSRTAAVDPGGCVFLTEQRSSVSCSRWGPVSPDGTFWRSPTAAAPYADRGYDFDKYRRLPWKRGIKPVIARRRIAHGSGQGKVRWMAERTCA